MSVRPCTQVGHLGDSCQLEALVVSLPAAAPTPLAAACSHAVPGGTKCNKSALPMPMGLLKVWALPRLSQRLVIPALSSLALFSSFRVRCSHRTIDPTGLPIDCFLQLLLCSFIEMSRVRLESLWHDETLAFLTSVWSSQPSTKADHDISPSPRGSDFHRTCRLP